METAGGCRFPARWPRDAGAGGGGHRQRNAHALVRRSGGGAARFRRTPRCGRAARAARASSRPPRAHARLRAAGRLVVSSPQPSLNPLRDLSQVLEYHFMINALLAGSIVAVLAALVGWMMVLRRETFTGHTLAVMAFPGAAGAALAGLPAAMGYFAFSASGGLAIAAPPGLTRSSWRERSARP